MPGGSKVGSLPHKGRRLDTGADFETLGVLASRWGQEFRFVRLIDSGDEVIVSYGRGGRSGAGRRREFLPLALSGPRAHR